MSESPKNDTELETAVPQESRLNFALLHKLPPGVQRVIIAALFITTLILMVVIRERIKAKKLTTEAESAA